MRIELLDEAGRDLVDGFTFYEKQSGGLGDYFLDSIFSDIESLHIYAGVHVQHFGHYRMLAKRFPFAIYYRVGDDTVRVYAVLDCRRSPAWIRQRLE